MWLDIDFTSLANTSGEMLLAGSAKKERNPSKLLLFVLDTSHVHQTQRKGPSLEAEDSVGSSEEQVCLMLCESHAN